MTQVVYGPVPSWRLGRSLGVDLISTRGKTCCFDCVYCQLGKTIHPLARRREFISISRLAKEIKELKEVSADIVTFSGVGEPTLASNLGPAIDLVKSILGLPVAVLTNSALTLKEDVREALTRADMVVAKLDAPNEQLFQKIDRPIGKYPLSEILQGIRQFRLEYKGKLSLQIMFINENKEYAPEMARIAKELSPDEVQINTPLRPCGVAPLLPEDLAAIEHEFADIPGVVNVYRASRREVRPLNLEETLRRRPQL